VLHLDWIIDHRAEVEFCDKFRKKDQKYVCRETKYFKDLVKSYVGVMTVMDEYDANISNFTCPNGYSRISDILRLVIATFVDKPDIFIRRWDIGNKLKLYSLEKYKLSVLKQHLVNHNLEMVSYDLTYGCGGTYNVLG